MNSLSQKLTSPFLKDVVLNLGAGQIVNDHDRASITPLTNALTGGRDFRQGEEGWHTYLHLR
jgi:hypothetical protein